MKHLHYDDLGFFIFLMSFTINLYYPLPDLYWNTLYIICIPIMGYGIVRRILKWKKSKEIVEE
jgi:hypothetical protein